METLGRQLEEARERLFVGREAELAELEELLSHDAPRRIAYIHGMGGMGKTQLLRAFARRARRRGWDVAMFDARDLPPAADPLVDVLRRGTEDARRLLLLDSFERLNALERPLRERVLPQLPASWRVVLAGRTRLGPAWTTDPGWRDILGTRKLGELPAVHAREYLEAREVAPPQVAEILELAGGVPLALALASEVANKAAPRDLEDDPDLVEGLLRHLVDAAPSADHHRALACSALARRTTEELLGAVVAEDRAPALFAWLASRPYTHVDRAGVYPHDVVRQVLVRRLRWQWPELVSELLVASGTYYVMRLRDPIDDHDAVEAIRAYYFLASHSAEGVAPLLVDGYYRYRCTEPHPGDWRVIEAILESQAGPEATDHLRRWRDHPAFEVLAVRRAEDLEPRGFFVGVQLHQLEPNEAQALPGIDRFYERFAPFDGPAPYVWLWGDRHDGHAVSPTQTLTMDWLHNQLLTQPDCTHATLPVRDSEDWFRGGTVGTSPKPVAGCEFRLGSSRYLVLNKAFSEQSPIAWQVDMCVEWLELMRRAPPDGGAGKPAALPAGVVLHALKAALKDADRPDRLAASELFALRIVAERAAGAPTDLARGRALVAYLRELAHETLSSPRDRVHRDAVVRTYFERCGSKQRAIAAELGLGYSTYRRYLATSIERLADALLNDEHAAHLGAARTP